jgi:hypothetical protein
MSPSSECASGATIRQVLGEFLEDRKRRLSEEDFRLYCHVTFFLELCINNHGHRNLDQAERAYYEKLYSGAVGPGRHFFEIFGPEKLLPEMDFFTRAYLSTEVHTTDRVARRAPEVVSALRDWLLDSGKLSPTAIEEQSRRSRLRSKLKFRMRRLQRAIAERVVSVDASALSLEDYVPMDDHPITRIQPGKIWLRLYDGASSREVGPLTVSTAATEDLNVGWNLCCALGRVKGRWRIVELQEIYPWIA